MKNIVLYSGGPDSFITYEYVRMTYPGQKVVPVYFNLGHRYVKEEMSALLETVPHTRINNGLVGLGIWEQADAFIPHRNIFLALAATTFMTGEPGVVWLSVQKDEMSIPDRSPITFERMNSLFQSLAQEKEKWELKTPWANHDKTDMVAWYLEQGLSELTLKSTWSCYWPRTREVPIHCGECAACLRRYIAFKLKGIHFSGDYSVDPYTSKMAMKYWRAAKSGEYSKERCKRIFDALGENHG